MKKEYPVLRASYVLAAKFFFLLFLYSLPPIHSHAQGYVRASQIWGITGNNEIVEDLIADNSGNTFMLASTTANLFPVTILPASAGSGRKGILVKLDPDGNTIWSRILPYGIAGAGATEFIKMKLQNGMVHLIGTTTAVNVPVTNGSVSGGGSDILYAKIDAATGAVVTTTYLGGNAAESTGLDIFTDNSGVYVTYATQSSDVSTTTGPAYTSGYDHIVQKLDGSGNIIYSTYTGNVGTVAASIADQASLEVENGNAYLGVIVNGINDFTVTNGSVPRGGNDFAVVKLDPSGNRTLGLIYGSTGDETFPIVVPKNDEIFLSGLTASGSYPVTDGSSQTGAALRQVLTKFTATGSMIYSSTKAGMGNNVNTPRMKWRDGAVYMMGAQGQGTFPYTSVNVILNTTDGSAGSGYLIKANPANGQNIFATAIGGTRTSSSVGVDFEVDNGRVYSMSPTMTANTYTVTDGSIGQGSKAGFYITTHTTAGKLIYATANLTGGFMSAIENKMAFSNGSMYVAGSPGLGATFAVTKPFIIGAPAGAGDFSWSALTLCPPMPADNTIGPLTQTVCAGGFTQAISGNKVAYESSNMPLLYRSGAPFQQMEITARYQWQASASVTGPWSDIAGLGKQKDYTPPAGTQTRYYRRLVFPPEGCGDATISTSGVAAVMVGTNTSPAVTAGIYNTCVGTPVAITANATGGTAPYTYAWDNGLTSTTANATPTPSGNSVYTVIVTDNNGCKQAGQVIVNAYNADAGPASLSSCAGSAVRIGTPPPAGLSGVVYSWSPAAGLDNINMAQPLASPAVTTTYTVSMTIPVTGGGTCTTTDQIIVNAVAPPATASFAGADKAVCIGGTLSIGTAAETAFTYTWAPGNYLNNVSTSITTFDAGSEQPQPNTFTYSLTAAKNGCTFTDAVNVSVLEVDAGKDLCGPRIVGTGDKISGVSGKIYLWEKVSGPGTITGATNTPVTTVSASAGASTTYKLTVSYLGVSCSDLVVVPDCSVSTGCPTIDINVVADHGCPSTAFGTVTLKAKPGNLPASEWAYSWTSLPAGGLSSATGVSVNLTDNIERDVTLIITSIQNPAVSCSKTIHVNGPAWALPVFNTQSHNICAAMPVSIGNTPVAGYSYTWFDVSAADKHVSNPTVAPAVTTSYYVVVKDDLSGCTTNDTAVVKIKPVVADPGGDWTACSSALIQLGSPALPGYTYSWVPAVANYQGGTNNMSAEPKVLAAVSQDFTLTATDTQTGCSKDSTIHIIIDNGPSLSAIPNKTICKGSSAIIGNPELRGVTYSWSPAIGLNSTTVAQPVANPAVTQTYTVTATYYDASGTPTCTKSGTVTVTVNAPVITMSDATICPSAALYNLSTGVTVTGASTYSWSPALLITNSAVLSTTVKANPVIATAYALTARDANGCATTAIKTITPTVAAPKAGSNSFVCVGTSISLGDVSNTGTITWSASPAIAGTLSNLSSPNPVFTPSANDAGKTFIFTISANIAGCTTTSNVSIIVKQFTLAAIPVQTICSNASTTIGVLAQPNVSYSWSPVTNLADPNAAITAVSNVTSTCTYTLTAIDLNGCAATSQAVIGVNPGPAPTVIIPNITTPIGSTPPPFNPQVSPAGTYTYSWSPASLVVNPYIANTTAIPGATGITTYTLTVTDINGCTSSSQVQLNVVPVTALPVALSYFTAKPGACSISLSWKAESASEFSNFIVERSLDGTTFNAIKNIKYEGNRDMYQYEDAALRDGKWAYRLKLVDVDGKFKYSPVIMAKVKCASGASLIVYPNPFSSYVNINSSKPIRSVTVFSFTGNVILSKEYNQSQAVNIQLNINHVMAAGVYLLQVLSQDGSVDYIKLVKQ